MARAGAPAGGTVTDEVVWNEAADTPPGFRWAGGGGQSAVFPITEAPWQRALGLTGMVHKPDVAALAGSPRYLNNGAIGTSGATPLTAGGIAVVDAWLQGHRAAEPAFLNPILYQLAKTDYASVFWDVTHGTNDVYQLGCCTAGVGYDMASGLGSVRFDQLAHALLARR
jgi:subtilase family serine protease